MNSFNCYILACFLVFGAENVTIGTATNLFDYIISVVNCNETVFTFKLGLSFDLRGDLPDHHGISSANELLFLSHIFLLWLFDVIS